MRIRIDRDGTPYIIRITMDGSQYVKELQLPQILSPDHAPVLLAVTLHKGSPRMRVVYHVDPFITMSGAEDGLVEERTRQGYTTFHIKGGRKRDKAFSIRFGLAREPTITQDGGVLIEIFHEQRWLKRLLLGGYGVVAILALLYMTTILRGPLNAWLSHFVSLLPTRTLDFSFSIRYIKR